MNKTKITIALTLVVSLAVAQLSTDGCVFDPPPSVSPIILPVKDSKVTDSKNKCPHGIEVKTGCCYRCAVEGTAGGAQALAKVPAKDLEAFQAMINRAYISVRDPKTIEANMRELLNHRTIGPAIKIVDDLIAKSRTPREFLNAVNSNRETNPMRDVLKDILNEGKALAAHSKSPDPTWKVKTRIAIWVNRLRNKREANRVVRWVALTGRDTAWPTIPPYGPIVPK